MTELTVWLEGRPIGNIRREGKTHMVFAYSAEWLADPAAYALSLSLPLQEKPFSREKTRAFFDNLLPEGNSRKLVGKRIHVSPENVFDLLRELGAECAGALVILPKGEPPPDAREQEYERLSNGELTQLIQEIPKRPLLAGDDGLRLSLAGAQAKLPIASDAKSFCIPRNGTPSTHILKPPLNDVPESVENEAFCMGLAKVAGLEVPDFELTETHPRAYVVQRYDRRLDATGIRRVHQEDFCQALGVQPELKYENEGGPGLEDCFRVLDNSADPAEDKRRLFIWCVFNHHIGNTDAHAKNISLLHQEGTIRLAPFYDLLCLSVYPGFAQKLTMRIGGQYDPNFLQRRHWERLGALAGYSPEEAVSLVADTTRTLLKKLAPTAQGFSKMYGESPLVRRIVTSVQARCEKTLERLATRS